MSNPCSSSFEWTSFSDSFGPEKFSAQRGMGRGRFAYSNSGSNNLPDSENQMLRVNVPEIAPLREIGLQGQNDESFQSRDTLQSLVQSCLCGNHHGPASHQTSIRYPCDTTTECGHLPPQQNKLMSKKSINVSHCSSLCFSKAVNYPCSRIGSNNTPSEMASKARIRWTEDLHKKFMESINSLGGARKATPKAILKLMKCEGLTIVHVKSHLQKYRTAQLPPEATENPCFDTNIDQLDAKTGMQIVEALRLQLDVQRGLYEQLESQKKLQVRIEEQAKQLQAMIQSQTRTNDTSVHKAN